MSTGEVISVDIRYVAWRLLIDGDNAFCPFINIFRVEPKNVVPIGTLSFATRRECYQT